MTYPFQGHTPERGFLYNARHLQSCPGWHSDEGGSGGTSGEGKI
eukprot:CAMPEP_0115549278 /NCGR_PEP_ID=MMETSP0271-20121206/94609_1 /TAXON_ID=71861 /ORGANISM="Scrippsiella trochoidea, Strain CCMP3099" /LENGTH=43 /DNA_ID= /DNA_START= /DNA_END= /DNA_ORIENTATION=